MIDFELTEQLIELENIQRQHFLNRARGKQASELLSYYKIPAHLYRMVRESGASDAPNRRTLVRFNFGLVDEEHIPRLIECLFFMGQCPDFIAEALGINIQHVADCLSAVIAENRARQAAELRANPQRFRIVK